MAFAVVLVGVAGYGFANGDPMLLLTTWDADGNGCGYRPATKDYPFLYFPAIDYNSAASASSSGSATDIMKSLQFSTCVKTCPSATSVVECYKTSFMAKSPDNYKDCVYKVNGYSFRYETTAFAGKFCVPSAEELKKEAF